MSRVLVVDDESDVRLMLRLALKVEGHEVDEAGTGAEALRALNDTAYDGVVLDVHLPDISGWDVLQRIRRSPTRSATPVVIVTADVSQRPGQETTSGFVVPEHVRLMYKPLDPHDLVAELEAELGGSAA